LTRLSEPQIKGLRKKMNQVRSMKLNHVAFRACSMGIKPDTMKGSMQGLLPSASPF
jgi:hypothetical protein